MVFPKYFSKNISNICLFKKRRKYYFENAHYNFPLQRKYFFTFLTVFSKRKYNDITKGLGLKAINTKLIINYSSTIRYITYLRKTKDWNIQLKKLKCHQKIFLNKITPWQMIKVWKIFTNLLIFKVFSLK